MKRWEYNTLKEEVFLFTLFLSIMLFELMALFYILFFAWGFCTGLAEDIGWPWSVGILVWSTRVITVVYMVLGAMLFSRYFRRENEKL